MVNVIDWCFSEALLGLDEGLGCVNIADFASCCYCTLVRDQKNATLRTWIFTRKPATRSKGKACCASFLHGLASLASRSTLKSTSKQESTGSNP